MELSIQFCWMHPTGVIQDVYLPPHPLFPVNWKLDLEIQIDLGLFLLQEYFIEVLSNST